MEIVKIRDLKPHSMNSYYFDDIKEDNWEQFLESVSENGIIEPIIITQDNEIVSGHQRVRACKELNIESIPARIRKYDDKSNLSKKECILEELILTNLRQRGVGNPNPIKMSRCIEELKRIKSIKHNNNYTIKDLSKEINISPNTISNYSKLTKLVPEIQDIIMEGKIPAKIGQVIFSKMDEETQKEMLDLIGIEKISNSSTGQVEKMVEIAKDNKKENIEIIKEIIKVIPPDDYEQIKEYRDLYKKELDEKKNELKKATSLIQSMKQNSEELAILESKRKKINEEVDKAERDLHNINKLYGDATDTLKKQNYINELLDDMKDKVKLLESKIIGFKPHRMGEENFKLSVNSFKELMIKSLNLIESININEKVVDCE